MYIIHVHYTCIFITPRHNPARRNITGCSSDNGRQHTGLILLGCVLKLVKFKLCYYCGDKLGDH